MTRVAGLLCLLLLQGNSPPADLIVGSWHGTSLCADKQVDRACHDEEVIYVIDSAAGPRGPVRMQADKIVNGAREPMGAFRLTYDSTGKRWFVDITMRTSMHWSFAVQGDSLLGEAREMPARRLFRRIAVGRCRPEVTGCPK